MTPEEQANLADLDSGDMVKIQTAAYWLEARHAYHLIDRMKESRKAMPARVALRDYRLNVDRCIRVLENFQTGAKCHCNLYHHESDFALHGETSGGFLTVENSVVHRDEYFTEYFAGCNHCQRKWHVKEIIGYHYPTFEWREINTVTAGRSL